MTPEQTAAMQRRANGGGLLDFGMGVGNVAKGVWDSMNTLQKVGVAPIPVVSDIAGLLGDAQMMYEQPEERTLANAGFAALGALPFVPAGIGATAWHGSPHKWDKVDLDKVGTGEGAQVYGHGFYSAQSKDVAEDYKAMTPAADIKRNFLSVLPEDADFNDIEGLLGSSHFNESQNSVIKALQEDDWLGFDYPSQAISAAYTNIDNYDPSPALKAALDSSGSMYKLDINDEAIETMLDWDKPVKEQSKKIQSIALEHYGIDDYDIEKAKKIPSHQAYIDEKLNKTGGELYRQIAFGNKPTMSESRGQKAASGLLNDAGIKGIKYLDGNSRAANKGTRNYVNFDADDVNVVSRNGDPIPDEGLLGDSKMKNASFNDEAGLLGSSDNADSFDYPPAENAAKTQISGTLPTYKKAGDILNESAPQGRSLDFGAGLGLGASEIGYETFEPYAGGKWTPEFSNPQDIPSDTYSRVTNLNVLNVVPKQARDAIVKDIGRVLKPEGQAIITTRGADVMRAAGKDGPEAMSKVTSRGTYQKGFTKGELVDYLQNILGTEFTVEKLNLGPAGAKITKKGN